MIYAFGDYELDTVVYELRHAGIPLDIEPKVFDLLVCLVEHRDRVISKDELLKQLWPDQVVNEWVLTYSIKQLRKTVGDTGSAQHIVKTVHGRGYHFVAPVDPRHRPAEEGSQKLAIPWNVPAYNPFFTGREQVLEALSHAFSSDHAAVMARPQAISGLGGIGKTQVAIQYAYLNRGVYQAVMWVNADTKQALNTSFTEIAHLLDLSQKNDENQQVVVDAVRRWLSEHRDWLLIFDNADRPDLIKPFLPPICTGHILITSRAQAFDMLGMSNPIPLNVLSAQDALAFLFQRVGRSRGDEAAMALVKELDGLPLALE